MLTMQVISVLGGQASDLPLEPKAIFRKLLPRFESMSKSTGS